ncbi:hypothetical protein WA026_014563 [Henosepilachna vigintioctopunctata]|uniref:Uncharacterized protein n=1 Tax=Henosepilachna vigintioctopunctata TaxID=420089 RepID=A0AAW1VDV6_9CUCU
MFFGMFGFETGVVWQKPSSQVVLTVQQRTSRTSMSSPSGAHGRPLTAHASTTITNPQPVDNEKQYQLQLAKEQHLQLMIEKEQRYIDLLRSQLATSPDEKKFLELTKTEKNLHTLQAMLHRNQTELPHCDSNPSPYPLKRLFRPTATLSPHRCRRGPPGCLATTPLTNVVTLTRSPFNRIISETSGR